MNDILLRTFFNCCVSGDVEKLKKILPYIKDIEVKNEFSRTGLAIAARSGNFLAVKVLFNYGANINAVNRNGTTIFMFAKTPLLHLKTITPLEWFLRNGSLINAQDKYGLTVLDYVEKEKDMWMAEWMKEQGAKLSVDLNIYKK